MSMMPANEVTAACVAEGAKTDVPDGLCPLFLARLAAALPDRDVVQAEDGDIAALTLVVMNAGASNLVARVDQPEQMGEPLGTARADAGLDDQALAQFLDTLIAATPLP